MALDNLEAASNAAGLSLKDAVKVGVFLKNPSDAKAFDAIYAEYVSDPPPARTLVQSNFTGFDIEVDAVLLARGA
ncbi:endoribonuclease L-PSP family protein (plasmid) [Burkholderia cepacia]|nr:endoribonuclease L-PSP family protein [Burkholderia cepacia]